MAKAPQTIIRYDINTDAGNGTKASPCTRQGMAVVCGPHPASLELERVAVVGLLKVSAGMGFLVPAAADVATNQTDPQVS